MSIRNFLLSQPRLLAFGFFAAFFSSFGQTFFIALSGAEIRAAFSLGHGDFGLIYSTATLSSAAVLIWAGRKIDDMDLRLYTALVCTGLGLACLGLSVVGHPLMLIPVIFALRFTGQGLMTHISSVSMARYFDRNRGKALSVSALGLPAGEALFPTLAVALIAWLGWRQMWAGAGLILLLAVVPYLLWLLKGQAERHRRLNEQSATDGVMRKLEGWTRGQVLRDRRFYQLVPCILAPSFIATGFFFHQVHLTESKGWDLAMYAGFFVIYATTQTLTSLVTGVLVDRLGARHLLKFYLLPGLLGLLVIFYWNAPWAGALFMALLGMTSGASNVVNGAVLAEIYGVAHLGAIKALGTALMVLASALSPPAFGVAIDHGVGMEAIALACAGYIIAASLLVTSGLRPARR